MRSSKNRTPTIADVARHAEVSIATASRVINGIVPVHSAKAERVRAAIIECSVKLPPLGVEI